jgi:biopolymer transport protein ExbD
VPASARAGGGAAWGGSPVPALAGLDGRYVDRLDTSPFVAVVFVVLVILMVLTPSSAGEWVPARAGSAVPIPKGPVWVGVGRYDRTFVDGKAFRADPRGLAEALRRRLAASKDPETLYLWAENRTPYSSVLDVLDAARRAGVRRVGLIVELPRKAPLLSRAR